MNTRQGIETQEPSDGHTPAWESRALWHFLLAVPTALFCIAKRLASMLPEAYTTLPEHSVRRDVQATLAPFGVLLPQNPGSQLSLVVLAPEGVLGCEYHSNVFGLNDLQEWRTGC